MGKKIAAAAVGAFIGYAVEQIAGDILQNLGVPPRTARLAGAVVGALVV